MNKSEQISLHVCLVLLQYYIESLTSAPLGHVVLLHFEIMLISYTYCINVDLKKVNPDLWTHASGILWQIWERIPFAHLTIFCDFSEEWAYAHIFRLFYIYHKGVMSDKIWYMSWHRLLVTSTVSSKLLKLIDSAILTKCLHISEGTYILY